MVDFIPKIVILRGNSGSGKSTVAKLLQREIGRGTLLIQQDYVRREMLWVYDTPSNPAVDLLKNLVWYGYNHNEVTILEGILSSDTYTDLFAFIISTFGKGIFAYYYDLNFEECLRRHAMKGVVSWGEEDLKRWWREKDYLPAIPETILGSEISVEDAIGKIKIQIHLS